MTLSLRTSRGWPELVSKLPPIITTMSRLGRVGAFTLTTGESRAACSTHICSFTKRRICSSLPVPVGNLRSEIFGSDSRFSRVICGELCGSMSLYRLPCSPLGVSGFSAGWMRFGVVNGAHRRTISAAPQEVSQSRRNYNVRYCSGGIRGSHVRSISDHTPLQCRQ